MHVWLSVIFFFYQLRCTEWLIHLIEICSCDLQWAFPTASLSIISGLIWFEDLILMWISPRVLLGLAHSHYMLCFCVYGRSVYVCACVCSCVCICVCDWTEKSLVDQPFWLIHLQSNNARHWVFSVSSLSIRQVNVFILLFMWEPSVDIIINE